MREFEKKWDLSVIYQVALVILDVCFINLCSVAALLVRFELSAVPVEYWESVRSMMIPNTIVTIGIFTVCRPLYRRGMCRILFVQCGSLFSDLQRNLQKLLCDLHYWSVLMHLYWQIFLSLCQNDLSKQCS